MDALLGAFKSKTVWLGLAVAVLSWVQNVVSGADLPADVVSFVGTLVGGLIVWLRAITTKPLAEK